MEKLQLQQTHGKGTSVKTPVINLQIGPKLGIAQCLRAWVHSALQVAMLGHLKPKRPISLQAASNPTDCCRSRRSARTLTSPSSQKPTSPRWRAWPCSPRRPAASRARSCRSTVPRPCAAPALLLRALRRPALALLLDLLEALPLLQGMLPWTRQRLPPSRQRPARSQPVLRPQARPRRP